MQRLVDAVDSPAYVLDRYWEPVVWNTSARRLFKRWLAESPRSRGTRPCNLLRFVFLVPEAREFIVGWAERAERLVAEFRADTARWRGDPMMETLVAELRSMSPDFNRYWRQQKVLGRDGGLRAFMHERTESSYEQFTLSAARHPDLKLNILVRSA